MPEPRSNLPRSNLPRPNLPHLTVGRLMILVAVAGLVAAFLAMGAESNRRLEVADRHFMQWLAVSQVKSEGSARLAEHHLLMNHKYREASGRPWAAVEPDPPAPE